MKYKSLVVTREPTTGAFAVSFPVPDHLRLGLAGDTLEAALGSHKDLPTSAQEEMAELLALFRMSGKDQEDFVALKEP